ncbi:hypothetical protein L830_4076 [Mycobacteroides abscessus MAB_082312_2258]|nr:hypothetical protein L830_4076 [Mycobacteroides abscessus MAB_082312_2258]
MGIPATGVILLIMQLPLYLHIRKVRFISQETIHGCTIVKSISSRLMEK